MSSSWFGGGQAAQDRARVMKQLDDLQKEDSMRTFNGIVERCFFNCVNSFTTSELEPREEQCIYRCTEKIFRHTERISRVWAEQSVLLGNTAQQQQTNIQQQQDSSERPSK